jgi:hypothetical protein
VGDHIERISFDTTDGELDLWVNEKGSSSASISTC